MSVELKPCPFCGGEMERVGVGPMLAHHPIGGACVAAYVELYTHDDIAAWNTRALEQREAGSKGREAVGAKLDARLEATKGLAFIQPEDMPLAMKSVQINGPVSGEWVRLDDAIEHAENIRTLAAAPSGGAA